MSQSRGMSFVEAVTNTFIGFCIALATQYLAYWLLDMHAETWQHATLVSIFTAVSVLRQYVVRRWFNSMGGRK